MPVTSGRTSVGQLGEPGSARYGGEPVAAVLLEQATAGVLRAGAVASPAERFALARLAAVRAGAAVLATRAVASRSPGSTRSRPRSLWALLAGVAPELREWSMFFAACAVRSSVTVREADDMVRQTEQFLTLARRAALRHRRGP